MANRRDFLKAAGASAGGAFLLGHGLHAGAQSARREIRLNGRRITTVDVHAHCVFQEVADLVAGTPLEREFPPWQMLGPTRLEEVVDEGVEERVEDVGDLLAGRAGECIREDPLSPLLAQTRLQPDPQLIVG